MSIIAACNRAILKQTHRRLLTWQWMETHWMREIIAFLLQLNGRSDRRSARLQVGRIRREQAA
jgi:hypothetical protein